MAVTLNGIAQGYICDRAADLLRSRGIGHVLLDLGEMRAIGRLPDGRPWHVGIADPRRPESVLQVLDAADVAVASSGGYGTMFDRDGRFHHLFEPWSGHSAFPWAGTTVVADTATVADALSTALAVAPRDRAAEILRAGGGRQAILVDAGGGITRLTA
jgi:thiamine biosynthesis lipoprotein